MAVSNDPEINSFPQFYDEDVDDDDDDDNHFIISLEDNGEEDEPDFHSGGRPSNFPNEGGIDLQSVGIDREYTQSILNKPDLCTVQGKDLSVSTTLNDNLKECPEQEILTFPTSCISKSVSHIYSSHKQTLHDVAPSNTFTQSNLLQASQDSLNLHSSLSSYQENVLHPSPKQLPEVLGQATAWAKNHLPFLNSKKFLHQSKTNCFDPETGGDWSEAVFESRLDGSFVKTSDISTNKNSTVEKTLSSSVPTSSTSAANQTISSITSTATLNFDGYIGTCNYISSATSSNSTQQTNVPRLSGPFSEHPPLSPDIPVTHATNLESCPCIMCFKSVSSNVISKKMQATPILTQEEIQIIQGKEFRDLQQRQKNGKKLLVHSKPFVSDSVNSEWKSSSALPKLIPARELSASSSFALKEQFKISKQTRSINSGTIMINPAPPSLLHKSAIQRDLPRSSTTSTSQPMSSKVVTVSPVQTVHLQASQPTKPASTVFIVSSTSSSESINTPKWSSGISVSSSNVPLLFQGSTKAAKIGSLVLGTSFPNSQTSLSNSIQSSLTKASTHSHSVSSQPDPKYALLPNKVFLKPNETNNLKVSRTQPPGVVLPKSTLPVPGGKNTKTINLNENYLPQSGRSVSLLTAPVVLQELKKSPVVSSSGIPKAFQHIPAGKQSLAPMGAYNIVYLSPGEVLLCRTPTNIAMEKNSKTFVEKKTPHELPSQPKQTLSQVHSEPLMINGNAQALNSVLNKAEQIDLTTPGKVRIKLKDQIKMGNSTSKDVNSCSPGVAFNSQNNTSKHKEKVPESSLHLSHPQFFPQTKQAQNSPTQKTPMQIPKSANVDVTGSTLLKLIDTHIENQKLTSSETALLHLIKGACKDPQLLAATCQLAALSRSSAPAKISGAPSLVVQPSNTTVKPSSASVITNINPSFVTPTCSKEMQSDNTRTFISTPSQHPSNLNNATEVKSVNTFEQPIFSVATKCESSSGLKGPHLPQERVPASYVQDWVNQSKTFMSNNKLEDLFYQEIKDIDRQITDEVLPHYQQSDAAFKSPPKKTKSKVNKGQLVASKGDYPPPSLSINDARPLLYGPNKEEEGDIHSLTKSASSKFSAEMSKYVSITSLADHSKHLSSSVTTSKGIKLKIRLNEKLKRHKALKKKSFARRSIKSSTTSSTCYKTKANLSESKTTSAIHQTDVKIDGKPPSDDSNIVALDSEKKKDIRTETAEEMFQRFQEQAQEEVYKAQLGVGYLSRSLRPVRGTLAFLDKLTCRDMASEDFKKKKLEMDQKGNDVKSFEKDVQHEKAETFNSEKIVHNEIRDKKTGFIKRRKISNFESSDISKAKASKIELAQSDYPNLKEDTSFPFTKNVYCSNILAGHKVFVKFNTYENKNTGRCFLIPFFNIGGKRRQFDVEDVRYFNKAVLEFEREERSCARHLLYFCRESNKASFLRKEGNFGGSQLHEKNYSKKSFVLEGFKMAAVKPKSSATQDVWKVDKEVAIEIDTAEVDNDIEINFHNDYLVTEGSKLDQPNVTVSKEIGNIHQTDSSTSGVHMKQPVSAMLSTKNHPADTSSEKAVSEKFAHSGFSNKSCINNTENVNEYGQLIAKDNSFCTEKNQDTFLPDNFASKESRAVNVLATEPCLMEIKKEKPDYFEFGSDLAVSTEIASSGLPVNFLKPVFPMLEIKNEPIDDNFFDHSYFNAPCEAQVIQTKGFSENTNELYQEVTPPDGNHENETACVSTEETSQSASIVSELNHLKSATASFVGNFQSEGQSLPSCDGIASSMQTTGHSQNGTELRKEVTSFVGDNESEAACVQTERMTQPVPTVSEFNHCESTTPASFRVNIPPESCDLSSSILCTEVLSCDAEKVQVSLSDQQPKNAQIQDRNAAHLLEESDIENKTGKSEERKEQASVRKFGDTVGSCSEKTLTCSEVEQSSPESPALSSSLSESSEVLSSSDLEESDIDHCGLSSAEAHLSYSNTLSVDLVADSGNKCGGQHKITSLVESLRQRLTQQTSTLPSWLSDTAPPVVHSRIKTKRKKVKKCKPKTAVEHIEDNITSQSNTMAKMQQMSNFVPLPEASGPACQSKINTSASTSNTTLSYISTSQTENKDSSLLSPRITSSEGLTHGKIQNGQDICIGSDTQKAQESNPAQDSSFGIEAFSKNQFKKLSETTAPLQPTTTKVLPLDTVPEHASTLLSLRLLTGFETSNGTPASKSLEPGFFSTDSTPVVQPEVKQEILDEEMEDPALIEFTVERKCEGKGMERNHLTLLASKGNQLSCRSTPSDIDIEVGCDDLPEAALRFQPILPDVDVERSSSSSESSRLSPVAAVVDFLHKRTQALSKNSNGSTSKSPRKTKRPVSGSQDSIVAAEQKGSVASYLTQKYSMDMSPGSGVWHTIKGPRLRKTAFRRPAASIGKLETSVANASDIYRSTEPISTKELSKKPSLSEIFGISIKPTTKSECEQTEIKREPDVESDPKITIRIRSSKKQVARKRTSVRNQKKEVTITQCLQSSKIECDETQPSTAYEPGERQASTDLPSQLAYNASTPLDSSFSPAQSEAQQGEPVESSQASDTSSVKNKNVSRNSHASIPKITLTWRQLSKLSEKQYKESDQNRINPCNVLLSRLEDTDLSAIIEPINSFTFRVKRGPVSVKEDPTCVKIEAEDLHEREAHILSQINKDKMLKRRKRKTGSVRSRKGSTKPKKDIVDHLTSMLDSLRKKALQLDEEAMKKQQEVEVKKNDEGIKKDIVKEESCLVKVLDRHEESMLLTKKTVGNDCNVEEQSDRPGLENSSGKEDDLHAYHEIKDAVEEEERIVMSEVSEAKLINRDQVDKMLNKNDSNQCDLKEASSSTEQMKVEDTERPQKTKTLQSALNDKSNVEVESKPSDPSSLSESLKNGKNGEASSMRLDTKVLDIPHAVSTLSQKDLEVNLNHMDGSGNIKDNLCLRENDTLLQEAVFVSTNVDLETLEYGPNKSEQNAPTSKFDIKSGKIDNVSNEKAVEANNTAKNDHIKEDMHEKGAEEDYEEDNASMDWEEPGALIIHLPEDESYVKKKDQLEEVDQVEGISAVSEKINKQQDTNAFKQIPLDAVNIPEEEVEHDNKTRFDGSYDQDSSKTEKFADHQSNDSSDYNSSSMDKLNGKQSEIKKACSQNYAIKNGTENQITSFSKSPFSFPKTDVVLSSVLDEELVTCLVKSSKKDELMMFEHQEELEGDDMGVIPQEEVERLLGLCDEDSGPVVLPGLGPLPNFEAALSGVSESLNVQSIPAENSNRDFSSSPPNAKFSSVAPCDTPKDEIGMNSNNRDIKAVPSQNSENIIIGSPGHVYRLPSQTTVLSQNKVFDQQTSRTKGDNDEEASQLEGSKDYSRLIKNPKTKCIQQVQLPKLNLKLDANAVAAIQKAKTAFLKKKNMNQRRNLRSNANFESISKITDSLDPQFQLDMDFYMRSTRKKNMSDPSKTAEARNQEPSKSSDSVNEVTLSCQQQNLLRSSISQSSSKNAPSVDQVVTCISSPDEISRKRKNDEHLDLESSCPNVTKSKKVESIFEDTDIFKGPFLKTPNQASLAKSNKPTLPVSELLKKTKGIDISKLKMKLNPMLSKSAAIPSLQNLVPIEKSQIQMQATAKKASKAEPITYPQASSSNSTKSVKTITLKEKCSPVNTLNQDSIKTIANTCEEKSNLKPLPNLNTTKLCNLLKNIQKHPVALKSVDCVTETGKGSILERKSQGIPSTVHTSMASTNKIKNQDQDLKGNHSKIHGSELKLKDIQKTIGKQSTRGLVGKAKQTRRASVEAEEKIERSFFDCLSSDQTEIWEEVTDA